MFTLAIFYIFIYYQILYTLFLYITIYSNVNTVQEYTISRFISFLKMYTSHVNYILLLLVILSGLPPVSFFLLKLVFLIKIFSTITLMTQLLFVLNFLIGMLFYLQVFNITNKNLYNSQILLNLNDNFSINFKNKYLNSSLEYSFWYFYSYVILVNGLGIFFFFDFFIIFTAFIN